MSISRISFLLLSVLVFNTCILIITLFLGLLINRIFDFTFDTGFTIVTIFESIGLSTFFTWTWHNLLTIQPVQAPSQVVKRSRVLVKLNEWQNNGFGRVVSILANFTSGLILLTLTLAYILKKLE